MDSFVLLLGLLLLVLWDMAFGGNIHVLEDYWHLLWLREEAEFEDVLRRAFSVSQFHCFLLFLTITPLHALTEIFTYSVFSI